MTIEICMNCGLPVTEANGHATIIAKFWVHRSPQECARHMGAEILRLNDVLKELAAGSKDEWVRRKAAVAIDSRSTEAAPHTWFCRVCDADDPPRATPCQHAQKKLSEMEARITSLEREIAASVEVRASLVRSIDRAQGEIARMREALRRAQGAVIVLSRGFDDQDYKVLVEHITDVLRTSVDSEER